MARTASAACVTAEGNPPSETDVELTPMMRQYLETKAQNPEAILFFRLGDFYEMFFDDAVKASAILQIALTSRSKGDDRVPMCGVPYHAARRYIAKLIEHGLKVAICEQMEQPGKGPKIVRREVIRVVTPGMVLDDEVLEASSNNFLLSIAFGKQGIAGALLDASTGEFLALERPTVAELVAEVGSKRPRELLVSEKARESPEIAELLMGLPHSPALATLDEGAFAPQRAEAYLRTHFQVGSLEGFGLGDAPLAVAAAGAALRYLKETQRTDGSHVGRISVLAPGRCLILDETSCANLEVLRTLREGAKKGSLLGVLDKTRTPMGARKLQRWLVQPLCSLPEIQTRLEAVEELFHAPGLRDELAALLCQMADLERLCARLTLAAGNARDLFALGHSLTLLGGLAQGISRCKTSLLTNLAGPLQGLDALAQLLQAAVADSPPLTLKDGGLIRPGFNSELDELVALSTSGKDRLLQIETRERERTGIGSLKVRYNKVFGYYLEVTKSNLHLVPADYLRKQTTVGAERYVTPELKDHEEKVLSAEERRCTLEYQIFETLRMKVSAEALSIRAAAEAVATCDVLLAFARCAAEYGYVRPVVDDSGLTDIRGGRHPVVERVLDREPFVPNNIRMDAEARLLLITGPNMAGKSTILRQVALTTLMAQAGSFVPAASARIGLCDRIFTRVGASDNLARGQSTFMVEMTETANILHHATERSLIVLDEIGRGTSTFDGLSIAWAVAEHLHDHLGARTLFATHYHELTALSEKCPRVKNCSIAVKEQNGKVVFLRRLVSGGASRSYGIEVARLAGFPTEVLARAREVLRGLEAEQIPKMACSAPMEHAVLKGNASERCPEAEGVLSELSRLATDQLTPLDALNLLAQWKKRLDAAAEALLVNGSPSCPLPQRAGC